ncbi:MAG TPA: formylglycine-generating enzyme family protein [Anaerolineae bacterium]|nr:formylglycine-generating enzyme family protein [Anaerolineae bacterium]
MKVNLSRILTIIASALILFTATPALSYVPDDLDFAPMGDGAVRTYTIPSINYKMVYIQPGTFMMGSPSNEPERDSDDRQHEVTLTKGFYMGATEVTQGQWREIMGNNPSKFKGDNLPVEQVSWNDCREFIRKLNSQEGGNKHRPPTEAEWEYACRAGSKTRFCFGDSDSRLGDYAWYSNNSSSKTHPVAEKKPNAWGLNVWEWCQDSCEYSGGVVTDTYRDGIEDPLCNSGSFRVYRGGSWDDNARFCLSAYRDSNTPDVRLSYLGFRLARTP